MKQVWSRSYTRFQKLVRIGAIGLFVVIPQSVLAYTLGFDPGGVLKDSSRLGTEDPAAIVFAIVNTSLIFLGTATLIMVIAAGFMWLFAGGQEEKITKAKDLLKGSLIGLVIVLSSFGVAQYIFEAIRIATTTVAPT